MTMSRAGPPITEVSPSPRASWPGCWPATASGPKPYASGLTHPRAMSCRSSPTPSTATSRMCRNGATTGRVPATPRPGALRMRTALRQRQPVTQRRSPCRRSVVAVLRISWVMTMARLQGNDRPRSGQKSCCSPSVGNVSRWGRCGRLNGHTSSGDCHGSS